ncbi:MAG: ATP-binding protein [Clostridiales bacterium]
MRQRIFGALCIIALISIVLSSFCVCALSYHEFRQSKENDIKDEATYVATAIETEGLEYLQKLAGTAPGNRITLIGKDGSVLYDNEVDAATMANHKNRTEVQEAFKTGAGEETRLSATMGQQTYYYAMAMNNGMVLRMADTTDSIFAAFFGMFPLMMVLAFFIFILALALSNKQVKWILAPLNNLDLEHPEDNEAYEEISPLLSRIHQQNDEIADQCTVLSRQQQEFNAITENMNEGLILLSLDSHILAVNQSAKNILAKNSSDDFVGSHLLAMNRNLSLQKVADAALMGESAQETFNQDNTFCIIHGSPVCEDGVVKGGILLVMDITQRYKAEEMRREFSANVSHELKTPLTAISGYAELLKNSMVNPKDIQDFSGRIHQEALHLIALIDDIIALSRLDERDITYLREKVNLMSMVENVAARLEYGAKAKDIKLNIQGAAVEFQAVPRLIDELIYNLVENAIKYSKNGGTVEVSVENTDSMAVLVVADQGVGIPVEYQERVFERFFRVDRSHAKATGGTGLGLAIVKHVTTYHHGTIVLNSIPDKGTKITVSFPL